MKDFLTLNPFLEFSYNKDDQTISLEYGGIFSLMSEASGNIQFRFTQAQTSNDDLTQYWIDRLVEMVGKIPVTYEIKGNERADHFDFFVIENIKRFEELMQDNFLFSSFVRIDYPFLILDGKEYREGYGKVIINYLPYRGPQNV